MGDRFVASPKYDLKIYLEEPGGIEPVELIPIFHRWIQNQSLEELLIDVVDYSHVHHGPGVVLVSHEAQYCLDQASGRTGLLYSRRRETHPGRSDIAGAQARLQSVFHCALTACRLLEEEPTLGGRARFRGDELMLRLNDRLLEPDAETVSEEVLLELQTFVARLYPQGRVAVERADTGDSDGRLTLLVKAAESPAVETLLARLGTNGSHRPEVPS